MTRYVSRLLNVIQQHITAACMVYKEAEYSLKSWHSLLFIILIHFFSFKDQLTQEKPYWLCLWLTLLVKSGFFCSQISLFIINLSGRWGRAASPVLRANEYKITDACSTLARSSTKAHYSSICVTTVFFYLFEHVLNDGAHIMDCFPDADAPITNHRGGSR